MRGFIPEDSAKNRAARGIVALSIAAAATIEAIIR